MKARDLILGVVAAVIFWMVVIAPMALSQGPVERPIPIQFDKRAFTPEQQAALSDFARDVEINLDMLSERIRRIKDSCCP